MDLDELEDDDLYGAIKEDDADGNAHEESSGDTYKFVAQAYSNEKVEPTHWLFLYKENGQLDVGPSGTRNSHGL